MPQMDFFPQRPEVHPMIYAYRDLNPDYDLAKEELSI